MSTASWLHGRSMALLDWLDSSAARAPLTVVMVVIGLGLMLSDRRSDRKARGL